MEYRQELKFLCSDYELEILKHRLQAILPYDSHQIGESYSVRSLYFDTADYRCCYENEAGVDGRKKYRIRIYDGSDQKITFEIKEKLHSRTKKLSHVLTRAEADSLLAGNYVPNVCDSAILNHFFSVERTDRFLPSLIVEYERTAFTCPIGNVRITFDRNLSASAETKEFFSGQFARCPIMPAHQHILEVKFDGLLPGYIAQVLDLGTLMHTSCSKYYLAHQACHYMYTQ